jgi:hypothetical protein
MRIEKWMGLATNASPYAIPPGAATRLNNLQIRKPGQLVPRPGMSFIIQAGGGAVTGMHRSSPGGDTADRLLVFRRAESFTAGQASYLLQSVVQVGQATQSSGIDQFETADLIHPSFAEDRHGSVFVFYGHNRRPQTYRNSIDEVAVDMGMDAPTIAPQVSPSGMGWFVERVDVLASGTSYYAPPTLTATVTKSTTATITNGSANIVVANAVGITVGATLVVYGSFFSTQPKVVAISGTTLTLDQSATGSGTLIPILAPGCNPVTVGACDRNATLKAVVQAGAIVAVDVVDGGSNFREVPTITVSNEQVGTGFRATGVLDPSTAIYGFLQTAVPSQSGATHTTTNTHAFSITGQPTIAYKSGTGTAFVNAVFSEVEVAYTANIPLSGTGTGAIAEVKFAPLSAAFRLGSVAPSVPSGTTGTTNYTGTGIQFAARRVSWNTGTGSNYFQNTYTPANSGIPGHWDYSWEANRDAFWGLMPTPGTYKFAKRQVSERWYDDGGTFSSGGESSNWANYYFPDYGRVGYRLLIGPETGMASEANWLVGSAAVQVSNGRPHIDIPLQPARKADGSTYVTQAGTVFPTIRFYLQYCPATWVIDNSPLPLPVENPNFWLRRYTPQSGQDRRTTSSIGAQTNTTPSGALESYDVSSIGAATDTATFWWNEGPNQNWKQARPIVDFRNSAGGSGVAGTDTAIAGGTVELLNAGSQMERGTKFVVRFEQYNAADYRVVARERSFAWVTNLVSESERFYAVPSGTAGMQRNGSFAATATDFFFEANSLDTAGAAASLLLPGAVIGNPRVVDSGGGWTAAGQNGSFTLRQRGTTDPASFTDSRTYTFTTTTLQTITAKRIGSVTITSSGQNYYREPTILYRGGGGYGLRLSSIVSGGQVTSVAIIDGGDGFAGDTELYTDVQPAKLMPVMRGTMAGRYRCAYRFADYRQTVVRNTTITTTAGSVTATLANSSDVKPGMQITGAAAVPHLVRIVSVSGTQVTLSAPATSTATAQPCVVRDMTLPIVYSDFSPIADVDANVDGSGRAARLVWSLPGVTAPQRAEFVEFYRTSADQSLVFYRLEQYGTVSGGAVTIVGNDALSDEELFNPDRPAYAALPVVLPNGGLNAYRFGVPRGDMEVAVSWQDRLWYGVSTSGRDENTVFFSEYDEYESCPDANELPIQANLRTTDHLTALIPFGSVLMAMQTSHAYSITFNTDPSVDAIITLAAHRGCFSHRCWDIFDDMIYAADERGVYRMSKNGEVESLSDAIRDYFDLDLLDYANRKNFHLRVDQHSGVLRLFISLEWANAEYPHMALCFHIRNEVWWTETWPNSFTSACDYRPAGRSDISVYGSSDGSIYEMAGLTDVSARPIQSVTVTNGGSGYVTPPTVTAPGGSGAVLQAIIENGVVVEVLVVDGGYGYGQIVQGQPFNANVSLAFSGGGGSGAAATAIARAPSLSVGETLPVPNRTTVPWAMKTGNFELVNDSNERRGGDFVDRSVTVTYLPTATTTTLNLREFYNNSPTPRPNVMRRDRGTGFVHETSGAKTTLDMSATRTSLGLSTGLAKAQFADRHLAIELSCDPRPANAGDPAASEPVIYSLEVGGVVGGS